MSTARKHMSNHLGDRNLGSETRVNKNAQKKIFEKQ